jgi:hypothetical protein
MMKKLIIFLIMLSVAAVSAEGQIFKRNASKRAEKSLFGKSRSNSKEAKVKQPKAAAKAQKQQEAKKKKQDSDYDQMIKKSQQRTVEIQTIERDKAKKKNTRIAGRKAGKKYK